MVHKHCPVYIRDCHRTVSITCFDFSQLLKGHEDILGFLFRCLILHQLRSWKFIPFAKIWKQSNPDLGLTCQIYALHLLGQSLNVPWVRTPIFPYYACHPAEYLTWTRPWFLPCLLSTSFPKSDQCWDHESQITLENFWSQWGQQMEV